MKRSLHSHQKINQHEANMTSPRLGRTMPLLLLTRIAGSPVTCQIAVVIVGTAMHSRARFPMMEITLSASSQSAIPQYQQQTPGLESWMLKTRKQLGMEV